MVGKTNSLLGSEGKFSLSIENTAHNRITQANSGAFSFSPPSTDFTNCIRTSGARVSCSEFDFHSFSWVRFTVQKLSMQCARYYGTSNGLKNWAHSAAKDSQIKGVKAFGGHHSHEVNSVQRAKGFWWQEHQKKTQLSRNSKTVCYQSGILTFRL